MRIILTLAAAMLAATFAFAQHAHHGQHGTSEAETADTASLLPQACRDAGGPAAASPHEAMPLDALPDHRRAGMDGMIRMDRDMTIAMAIEDADMAFMCGMIAHHQGAIAMSEVVLEHGADEAVKALARRIIEAQGPEIDEMTRWVEERAR